MSYTPASSPSHSPRSTLVKAKLVLVVLTLSAAPALAQDAPRQILGHLTSIEKGEQNPVSLANVLVNIREFERGGLTDDEGKFRISLPPSAYPGQEVTLQTDKDGYRVCAPLLAILFIPPEGAGAVEIRMLPEGSKLFWTPKRIEEFIAHTARQSARQPRGQPIEEPDMSAYVLQLARYYGFTAEEVRREIAKWVGSARTDSTDFRRQGIAAFADKNFRLAGEKFIKGAEQEARLGSERLRHSAKYRELAGDAFYGASDFGAALAEYHKAHTALGSYRDSLGALAPKVYPDFAVDVRQLRLKTANTEAELGKHIAGPASSRYLEESAVSYRKLIAEMPRTADPVAWAAIQDKLGAVLHELGGRQSGDRGVSKLNESVEVLLAALTVRTREASPRDWAQTQNNLGVAQEALGRRLAGVEGSRKLGEAIECYKRSLLVYTRDRFPQNWAAAQNNLASALRSLGEREGGREGRQKLADALEACRQALTVYVRDEFPQDWAATQNNLGLAFKSLGTRQEGADGTARLFEAVDAYRRALTVYNRDQLSQDWAATQDNLGTALTNLAKRQGGIDGTRLLSDAVSAHRLALTVRTRDDFPQHWAATQNNLGIALKSLGERQEGAGGARWFSEAVTAYKEALVVFTRDTFPQQWAATQNNLGNALASLGDRQPGPAGAARLAEAEVAFREALAVFTRSYLPQDWAMTQDNLGTALMKLAVRKSGAEAASCLSDAVGAFREALAIRTRHNLPQQWAQTQKNLGLALQSLVGLGGFTAGVAQFDRLTRDEGIRDDPAALAPLLTFAIVCNVGTGDDRQASRTFASLTGLVERQPDDFRMAWEWDPLHSLIQTSETEAIKTRRESLHRLLDAVSQANRLAILDGLKQLQEEFPSQAQDSKKEPR
jgi:tetratricopeptide (TPR) repeat protein